MMKNRTSVLITSLLLAFTSACDDFTGTPQPLPIPSPHEMRLGGAPSELEMPVDIVGLPGAVGGPGKVTVINGDKRYEAHATEAGTFFVSITARGHDDLDIRYEDSDPAQLKVPVMAITTPGMPGPIDGVAPITPQGEGEVLVRGMLPGITGALVVNTTQGAVAIGPGDAQQHFAVTLAASSGDALRVYEDGDDTLGAAWDLTVP